jgi:hypothetical protein
VSSWTEVAPDEEQKIELVTTVGSIVRCAKQTGLGRTQAPTPPYNPGTPLTGPPPA